MTAPARESLQDMPFDTIVEQAVAGIYVIQDDRFVYCNATWAAIVGYTAEEMTGMSLAEIVPPDFVEVVRSRIRIRLAGNPPSMHFITRGLHRDGRVRFVEVHGSRIEHRGRPAVMGVGVDVTDRVRNEEERQRSREQLQALAAYTANKLEEQRLALSRDVHDVLGGMLTSIKMDVTRIQRRADNPEVQALTQDLIALTQQTIDTVKQISEALRPSALDHLDLSVALAHELQAFTRRSGVLHSLDTDAPALRLAPKQATAVYRIFQEGLTNVLRHAKAQRVDVRLRVDGERLRLALHDDGCGFDPDAPEGSALGLLSMRERAREIGGELHIHAAPDAGTRLALSVPLLQPESGPA
ncbi:PAS domain S-box protein [Variovorax sp. KBS0712]|uniref:sensor histidine kinase n=1 Tax=Variovorax sp. KBS0712 TaxID=2578111 RepID=UPI00111B47F8|nr:PAS domain S-box protein [Variovorax sp. KBS0712]TSD60786.1 PAS domain S-box protein [Variovorax sp. KBS0712]